MTDYYIILSIEEISESLKIFRILYIGRKRRRIRVKIGNGCIECKYNTNYCLDPIFGGKDAFPFRMCRELRKLLIGVNCNKRIVFL